MEGEEEGEGGEQQQPMGAGNWVVVTTVGSSLGNWVVGTTVGNSPRTKDMKVETKWMMKVTVVEESLAWKVMSSQQPSLSAPCLAPCQRTGSALKVPIFNFQMQISRIFPGAN